MIISARGNADSLVVAAVMGTLLLIQKGKVRSFSEYSKLLEYVRNVFEWYHGAVVHGALAVQLKLYPIILLIPVYLHSIERQNKTSIIQILHLRSVFLLLKKTRKILK